MDEQPSLRLNKFVAQQLNLGRRAADELIEAGKITLNGKPATLGARVSPDDTVIANGVALRWQNTDDFLYILMNKPKGYVCSRRQQGDAPTIYSLMPTNYQHLKTVGRLDKNSSGLILLTNDGDTAHRLTHPSFVKIKQYEVTLNTPLQPLHHQMIADHGVMLGDGPSKFQLSRMHDGDDTQWRITMHEGRNRQIRRTFAALGYDVVRLHRTHFGPFSLNQMGNKQMMKITLPPQLEK